MDERTELAKVETGKGIIRLTQEVFDFWQLIEFNNESIPEDEASKWDELKQKGILICAETTEELNESIKNLYPFRQGVLYKSEENTYIVLGEMPFEIVKLQSFIWKSADGKRNLGDIYLKADSKEFIDDSEPVRDFVESVVGLVRAGVLILKN
jgi:hypothetical protein